MPREQFPSSEYKLLNSLKPFLHYKKTRRYPLSIGDDAAIRTCSAGEKLVITADSFVQDVHFRLSWMTLEEVGFKAMAINLSDCAAMGASPDGALVQIIFPKALPAAKTVADIRRLYVGLFAACKRWDFPIIGGNLSAGPCWIVDITLLGRAEKSGRLLLRTGAKKGDTLWVTGRPGESGAGLAALRKWGRRGVPRAFGRLVQRHVRPTPRIEMGLALAADPRVHALMDISDGISKECRTLAFDNKLAIELEADPACISPAVKELGTRLGTGWREWYLDGGEDYELLFAAGRSFDPGPLAARHGVPLTRIGSFVRQRGRAQVSIAGAIAGAGGWDHLRKNLL